MGDPARHVTSVPAEDPRPPEDPRFTVFSVPPPALVLDLVELPADRVRGIYTIGGVPGRMPARALFLHPSAAASFLRFAEYVVVSDLFRSPESSLAAVRAGRGAKPPGFSGHNYGLSIDLDVRASIRRWHCTGKADLDATLAHRDWLCHRLDHAITPLKGESHHYNYLPDDGAGRGERSTALALERTITELYGHAWRKPIDPIVAQAQLARLGLYKGDLDGKIGPLSRAAVRVFRRGWGLGDSDRIDARTWRTLVYVAAGRRIHPSPLG